MPDTKYRFFKIEGQSVKDKKQIDNILKSKQFYPDFYSDPQLPETPSADFDYREFFLLINPRVDDCPVVFTRDELTLEEFSEQIFTSNHWDMYYVTEEPTVTGVVEDLIVIYDKHFSKIFTSYQYPSGDYRVKAE